MFAGSVASKTTQKGAESRFFSPEQALKMAAGRNRVNATGCEDCVNDFGDANKIPAANA